MRALSRLEAVLTSIGDRGPITLGALTELVDLPKPTVMRLLVTLEESGWVTKDRSGAYSLGPTLTVLARRYLERDSLATCALPYMEALRDDIGETISLSVRTGTTRIYVAEFPSNQPMRFVHELNKREPIHTGASGRLLMAWLDDKTRNTIYRAGLERLTDVTITDVDEMEATLAETRRQGYAISYGEKSPGALGLAVPLVDPVTDVLYGLAVFAPLIRYREEQREEWIRKLRAAADQIIEARRRETVHGTAHTGSTSGRRRPASLA
ncbi:IclR family transcriptional regulator [Actinophytocola sp.]|uniref:IclR family transcriptional regulator n=1 Tax=Actinophytocola sp. TaxID=1872138 RepID=UPI003D6B4818